MLSFSETKSYWMRVSLLEQDATSLTKTLPQMWRTGQYGKLYSLLAHGLLGQ